MKRPPALQFNSKAVILSPAGKIEGGVVENAAKVLEGWGLRPQISEYALCDNGRFSGSVEQRLADLQRAFDDPTIKLIFCARGGYGAVHLLDKLDFSGIRKNPKWVVGYSDITLLHAALQAHGVISIHAPMAKHFSDEGPEDIAVRYTKSILAGQSVKYEIPIGHNALLNRRGRASGRLFGGNLSVFCSLFGSVYAKIPRGGILFIEDIGESPYKVDRMMHQLKLAGVFKRISGLIVGRFVDYNEDSGMSLPLRESILHLVEEYNFPVCFDFPVGHVKLNFPLVMGAKAFLNVENGFVSFIQ